MSSRFARHGLRTYRASFVAPAVTQWLGGMLVGAAFLVTESVSQTGLPAAARQALRDADVAALTTAFLLVSAYLTVLVVGITMAATIARQRRDIALVRTIGATPGQIRRAMARQAAVVAVPAAALGGACGIGAARGWLALLQQRDIVPRAVEVSPSISAPLLALAVVVPASTAGALVAALRPARRRPAAALVETATGGGAVVLRVVAGVVLLLATLVSAVLLADAAPDDVGDAVFFLLLAACLAVGLLGPWLLRCAVVVLGGPLRLLGGIGVLARDNLRVLSRPLSGVLVPLILAGSFVLVKVGLHASAAAAGRPDNAPSVWLDYTGSGVYAAFAGVAAMSATAAVVTARRSELARLRLAGATRGQVVRIVGTESAVLAGVALVLGAAVAALPLVPAVRATSGRAWPTVPGMVVLPLAAAIVVLVVAGATATAFATTRRRGVR